MNFKVKTFPNKEKGVPLFFVQNKGHNSGRPLKKAIPNCFAVYSKNELLFDVCHALWKAKAFDYYIIGSVIPFIRKGDFIKALSKAIPKQESHIKEASELSKVVKICEKQEEEWRTMAEKTRDLQQAYIMRYLRNVGFKFKRS